MRVALLVIVALCGGAVLIAAIIQLFPRQSTVSGPNGRWFQFRYVGFLSSVSECVGEPGSRSASPTPSWSAAYPAAFAGWFQSIPLEGASPLFELWD